MGKYVNTLWILTVIAAAGKQISDQSDNSDHYDYAAPYSCLKNPANNLTT
jgi:hypothetical protein